MKLIKSLIWKTIELIASDKVFCAWFAVLFLVFCGGLIYTAGVKSGRHDNYEINRLWNLVDSLENDVAVRDLRIETQNITLRTFRLELMECRGRKE